MNIVIVLKLSLKKRKKKEDLMDKDKSVKKRK